MSASWLLAAAAAAAPIVVDDFSDPTRWQPFGSDGKSVALRAEPGAVCLDYDFRAGGGYLGLRRALTLELPPDYRIHVRWRGVGAVNDFEFKLLDETGENVWWSRRPGLQPVEQWSELTIKKRQVNFAWGPLGGGELRRPRQLEFVLAAAEGGAGQLCFDQLTLEPYEAPATTPAPKLKRSAGEWIADYGVVREFGGISMHWTAAAPARYQVETSRDGKDWLRWREVVGSDGQDDALPMADAEARYLRISAAKSDWPATTELRDVVLEPLEFGSSTTRYLQALAQRAPRGLYPRSLLGEQAYWTVIGSDGGEDEALFSEDGIVEAGHGKFTIEPLVECAGRRYTWADVSIAPHLTLGAWPRPEVIWSGMPCGTLRIEGYAAGVGARELIGANYWFTPAPDALSPGSPSSPSPLRLWLAIRPFQVNTPAQFLGRPGGAAPIKSIERVGERVVVDGQTTIRFLDHPVGAVASRWDEGPLFDRLASIESLPLAGVEDPVGLGSLALAFDGSCGPGGSGPTCERGTERERLLAAFALPSDPRAERSLGAHWDALVAFGSEWLERNPARAAGPIDAPDTTRLIGSDPEVRDLAETLAANLAYILINRDGPRIQPGSRAYARSWIRDGSLTSVAMLRMGQFEPVKQFLLWFAPFQFESGKVPCCVDKRGNDPVPENDSHGQLIYLIGEYLRYSGDELTVRQLWPHVDRAVAYIESLRQSRRIPPYDTAERKAYFGLVPESISHEGYSSKPVHSYWDDAFTLVGLRSAVQIAARLGQPATAARFRAIHDEFRAELLASIEATIEQHELDVIPASVELGDFDPTSTTASLEPGGLLRALPAAALRRTFDRYWESFSERAAGRGKEPLFTPYELRTIGSFVRLGQRERALGALRWFMTQRQPPEWRQWPEVVRFERRTPFFVGDMPHTWVGSDFIRSALDLFVYEDEERQSLVIGAGIDWAWCEASGSSHPPLELRQLHTPYGVVSLLATARAATHAAQLVVGGDVAPPGGLRISIPESIGGAAVTSLFVDGRPVTRDADGTIGVPAAPATITFRY